MGLATSIAAIFRSRAADVELAEPPVPEGYAVTVSGQDDQSTVPVDDDRPVTLAGIGCAFGFLYEDDSGQVTWRRVTVRGLAPEDDDVRLRAYCHERHAPRLFRSSRVRELVNLRTGEVIDHANDYFRRFLSDDPTFLALRRCAAALQILTFLARCDGEDLPSEQDIVVAYVLERCPDLLIDKAELRRHVTTLHPDEESFQMALYSLEAMPVDEAMQIVDGAIRIIEADGVLDPSEVRWLDEIREALR